MEEIPKVSSTFKLAQDFAKLVNNPVGSDVQFLVGSDGTEKEGDSARKQSQSNRVATFYGHSSILCVRSKYFAAIFDNDKQWKETSSGIFRKPNISPAAFHVLLRFIYTSNMDVDKFLLPELIAAAEEMELAELSAHCQNKLLAELKESIVDADESNDRNTAGPGPENGQTLSFNLAICNLLIPGLVVSYEHNISQLFDELLQFTFENIDIVLASKDTLRAFLDNLPLAIFKHILSSDSLALEEYDVWQLSLNWACHQTKTLKANLEMQLRSNFYDHNNEEIEPTTSNTDTQSTLADQPLISDERLQEIKAKLTSLTSSIRFTLMKPEQYAHETEYFNFFLPGRRLAQLQRFFSIPNSIPQDLPRCKPNANVQRKEVPIPIPDSKIADGEAGLQLRKWIHESRGISSCSSPEALKFKLLFRATDNGFGASTFHQYCDNQGPTLLLVRSSDGHLFGGVNFISWAANSPSVYVNAAANFLFALKDERYRSQSMKFDNITGENSALNSNNYGPIFGAGHDLLILSNANISQFSYSKMPKSYGGNGASNTSLAGAQNFTVSDYEVYAIS